jgi:hypothetical protein
MNVINPDLIFGNALTYTADDIVSKLNFPSLTKKMVDRLNQLVLVKVKLSWLEDFGSQLRCPLKLMGINFS